MEQYNKIIDKLYIIDCSINSLIVPFKIKELLKKSFNIFTYKELINILEYKSEIFPNNNVGIFDNLSLFDDISNYKKLEIMESFITLIQNNSKYSKLTQKEKHYSFILFCLFKLLNSSSLLEINNLNNISIYSKDITEWLNFYYIFNFKEQSCSNMQNILLILKYFQEFKKVIK